MEALVREAESCRRRLSVSREKSGESLEKLHRSLIDDTVDIDAILALVEDVNSSMKDLHKRDHAALSKVNKGCLSAAVLETSPRIVDLETAPHDNGDQHCSDL